MAYRLCAWRAGESRFLRTGEQSCRGVEAYGGLVGVRAWGGPVQESRHESAEGRVRFALPVRSQRRRRPEDGRSCARAPAARRNGNTQGDEWPTAAAPREKVRSHLCRFRRRDGCARRFCAGRQDCRSLRVVVAFACRRRSWLLDSRFAHGERRTPLHRVPRRPEVLLLRRDGRRRAEGCQFRRRSLQLREAPDEGDLGAEA